MRPFYEGNWPGTNGFPPQLTSNHDDVIKWKYFPRYWTFVRGIHRSPVNSPHKGQWRGALIFSLICAWINGWVKSRDAGNLRCYRVHYDGNVMMQSLVWRGWFHDWGPQALALESCHGNQHATFLFVKTMSSAVSYELWIRVAHMSTKLTRFHSSTKQITCWSTY